MFSELSLESLGRSLAVQVRGLGASVNDASRFLEGASAQLLDLDALDTNRPARPNPRPSSSSETHTAALEAAEEAVPIATQEEEVVSTVHTSDPWQSLSAGLTALAYSRPSVQTPEHTHTPTELLPLELAPSMIDDSVVGSADDTEASEEGISPDIPPTSALTEDEPLPEEASSEPVDALDASATAPEPSPLEEASSAFFSTATGLDATEGVMGRLSQHMWSGGADLLKSMQVEARQANGNARPADGIQSSISSLVSDVLAASPLRLPPLKSDVGIASVFDATDEEDEARLNDDPIHRLLVLGEPRPQPKPVAQVIIAGEGDWGSRYSRPSEYGLYGGRPEEAVVHRKVCLTYPAQKRVCA